MRGCATGAGTRPWSSSAETSATSFAGHIATISSIPPGAIPRLLVLGVGTQVGQNILATLAGRRDRVVVVATSSVSNEPSLFDVDAVYLVPATAADPAGFERRLLDIVERERIDLVIPCRDDDVLFLASLRDRRPDLAARLLCGSASAAATICDKWASHEFCGAQGLPFADSIVAGAQRSPAAFVREHGLPLVGKPRRGYASRATSTFSGRPVTASSTW